MSKTIAILTSGGDSPGMNAAIRAATVRALLAGEHRKMVSWLPPMDLPDGVGARSKDDPYCYLVDLPAVLAATKQLLEGQSPLARWRASAFDDLEDVFLL